MMLLAAFLAVPVDVPADEIIRYKTVEALVVNQSGKPLFRTTRDFLLQISGNPDGRIYAYDPAKRRVRVSDNNPWWISCSELEPQAVACAKPEERMTRSGTGTPDISVGDAVALLESRGVPSCPGDPRCPTGN